MVKNPPSNAGDTGSTPAWRTEITPATGQLIPYTTRKAPVWPKFLKKRPCIIIIWYYIVVHVINYSWNLIQEGGEKKTLSLDSSFFNTMGL